MNRIWFAAVLIWLLAFAPLIARAVDPSTAPSASTAVIGLRGDVDDFERDALMRRFRDARRAGAKTIILEIDTYGGLVTSGLDISRFIKQQSDLHTIAFVHDKAISAGAMIALACDEIVMQPSATLGDCAPIIFRTDGTLESMPAAERAKQESPILADFRDSAVRNGYDVTLVESMVAVDRVVHLIQDSNGSMRKFVDDAEYKQLIAAGWKPASDVPDPVDRADSLLTVLSSVAEKIGLSAGTFASTEALVDARGFTVVGRYERGMGEVLIELLASPIARLLCIVIFVGSLKLALTIPGHGAPEAVALVSLGLLIGMPLLTGYATWWEVVMIFAGLALLAFEIFIFPGHFVSAAVGILLMIAGLVLTFVGAEPSNPNAPGLMPNMQTTVASIERGLIVVTAGLVCSLILWAWLTKYLPKIPYFSRLVLAIPGDAATMGGASIVWPLVGSSGRATSELKPGGSAEFFDQAINDTRIISVVSDGGFVSPGTGVTVSESRGNHIVVRPIS